MYKIPNRFASLQGIASKDATRYNICGVYFDEKNKAAVATNGHALAVKPYLPEEDINSPDCNTTLPNGKIAVLPKTAKASMFINEKGINELNPKESVSFTEGQYPDWSEVIKVRIDDETGEPKKPIIKIGLSADTLLMLAKAIDAPSYNSKQIVELEIFGEHDAIRVSGGRDGAWGVIMPARLPK